MPIKRIAMMLVAACVVGLLTGCGVPKDEHEAVLAELDAEAQKNVELTTQLEERGQELQTAEGRIKNIEASLADATKQITELQDKEAATALALENEQKNVANLEGDLETANTAISTAKGKISELEDALAALQEDYAMLQNRFNELKKNMLTLGATGSMPEGASTAPAAAEGSSKSDAETAMGLLDDMGAQ